MRVVNSLGYKYNPPISNPPFKTVSSLETGHPYCRRTKQNRAQEKLSNPLSVVDRRPSQVLPSQGTEIVDRAPSPACVRTD